MGVREPSSVCPGMMFSLFGKRARDPHGQRLFEARFGGRGQDMGGKELRGAKEGKGKQGIGGQ